MLLSNNSLAVNEKGNLTIGNCDTTELAKEFGTPLYVVDETVLRNNCRKFDSSMKAYYGKGLVIYASKALNCMEVCRVVADEGLGLDVASGGELYTALKSGFPAEKIYFHGNNKTEDELVYAVKSKIGRIIVDNPTELARLDKIAAELSEIPKIMFRIKPGIDAHTHDFVKTGQIDSKFGFALENGEAFEAVKLTKDMKHLELVGLHCHIGSQIFDIDPFILAAEVMLNFYLKIKNELGMEFTDLNLGGGFGIKYTDQDDPKEYNIFMEKVSAVVKGFCEKENLLMPFICIEPGRSIIAPAGITLYTVGAVKEIENVKNYILIDGGMGDNPRYALYKSAYTALLANKAGVAADYTATIAGRCCESGDLIAENIQIQTPAEGDILAVLATGAYNYSMSSNYNRFPRPPIVMVKDGKARVVVKRETYEDIIRNDI
ncbi:MAG: diaminopimelate decarboxylase [Clostridiales bacterium 43-6]|nr:MAG: diaminopimelate decarboxylase [Clostridiales bacterium 43-6]